MIGKLPVLLALCTLALSACAGMREPPQGLSGGKPLTAIEKQQVECQARLGKVDGIRIDQKQGCVMVIFRCDSLFERNADRILPVVKGLDDLADILKQNHETKIMVDAHTDCTRSEEDNLILSENRAEAMKEALVMRGVEASRITARGWGESKPAATNATEAGRQANRRLTVTLLPSS